MNAEQLKSEILSLNGDIVFTFNGVSFCIIPFNSSKFQLCIDDRVTEYNSIDALFSDPIFFGKTLSEIAGQIEIGRAHV